MHANLDSFNGIRYASTTKTRSRTMLMHQRRPGSSISVSCGLKAKSHVFCYSVNTCFAMNRGRVTIYRDLSCCAVQRESGALTDET